MIRPKTGRQGRHDRKSFFVSLRILVFALAITAIAVSAFADTLKGRVVDPQSRPIASADVLVQSTSGRLVTTVRTRPDGTFGPVTLEPGDYVLLVAVPGLRSTKPGITVRAGAETDIEVRLVTTAVSESVVVSAAQVDTPLSRVSDSITVIDSADLLGRQAESVAQAIRVVPGFGVVASGGRGAVTSLFPRGGESDYTLVLVDGIPQNAFGGGFDAAHLSAAGVQRIEVVRGPQSALYGSGAIGGLVHVITRNGGAPRADGLLEFGNFGTVRTQASGAGSARAWHWGGAVEGLKTDGEVANDDYSRSSVSGSLAWSDRSDRRFSVNARGSRNERGFPGPFGADPLDRFGGIDTISRGSTSSRQIGLSAAFGSAAALRHRATLTWADLEGSFVSRSFFDPTVADPPTTDRSRRLTGRYQLDLDRPAIGVSAGVEGLRERADNTFVTDDSFATAIPIKRTILGLFAEARPVLGDRVSLTAGVRAERITRLAMVGDGFSRPTFDTDDVVWSVNPKIAASWFLREPDARGWTKIRGGAGTGIKPPTTFELGFTSNPALKPERSRSADIGIEHALAGSAIIADVTWFANRYDDLIVTVPANSPIAGASQFTSDNIANARAMGLEAGVSYRAANGLAVRGAWTWLDTEILAVDGVAGQAPSPFVVGDGLVRRPRHQGSLQITWTGARSGLFAVVNGRGAVKDLEPNFGAPLFDNPGYAVLEVGGSFRISRGLEVIGRVSNALDRRYEDVLGFPALGRAALVGIRVAAGR